MSAYSDAVLADAPTVYYRLGDLSGGYFTDSSGHGYNGQYGGGIAPTVATPGAIANDTNGCMYRPANTAAGQYVHTYNLPAFGDTISVEMWFKRTRANVQEFLTCMDNSAGAYPEIFFNPTTNLLTVYAVSGGNICYSTSPYTDTNWHHMVFTKSGSAIHLYIDGIDATAGVTNRTLPSVATYWTLGDYQSGVNYSFQGYIDEYALYPTALSADRVAAHYKAALPPPPSTGPLDDFSSYADGTQLVRGYWGPLTPWDQWPLVVTGGQAYNSSAGNWGGSYWTNPVSLASAGAVNGTIAVLPGSGEHVAVSLYDSPTTSTPSGYELDYSNGEYTFIRYDTGGLTVLQQYPVTLHAGDVMAFAWDGAGHFTIYQNQTVIGTITDTTHTGNVYMALEGNNTTFRWDNFGGFVPSAGPTPTTYTQTLTASQASVAIQHKYAGKWVILGQGTSPKAVKLPTKHQTASQAQTAKLPKQAGKHQSASQSQAASVPKQAAKHETATQTQTTQLPKQAAKSESVDQAQTVSVGRTAVKILTQAVSQATSAVVRLTAHLTKGTGQPTTVTASGLRVLLRTLAVAQASTTSVRKLVGAARSVAQGSTANSTRRIASKLATAQETLVSGIGQRLTQVKTVVLSASQATGTAVGRSIGLTKGTSQGSSVNRSTGLTSALRASQEVSAGVGKRITSLLGALQATIADFQIHQNIQRIYLAVTQNAGVTLHKQLTVRLKATQETVLRVVHQFFSRPGRPEVGGTSARGRFGGSGFRGRFSLRGRGSRGTRVSNGD